MANLTAARILKTHGASDDAATEAIIVDDAVQVYAGSLVGVDNTTGEIKLWADVAAIKFLGLALRDVLGDATPAAGTARPEAEVNTSGVTLEQQAVSAVALTNVGDFIYAADDNVLQLAATTNTVAIGRVTRFHSTGICDVKLFTPDVYLALE